MISLNMQQFLIRAKNQEATGYLEFVPERVTILAEALERIYAKTGKQFIFLIDEWDCVIERVDVFLLVNPNIAFCDKSGIL